MNIVIKSLVDLRQRSKFLDLIIVTLASVLPPPMIHWLFSCLDGETLLLDLIALLLCTSLLGMVICDYPSFSNLILAMENAPFTSPVV